MAKICVERFCATSYTSKVQRLMLKKYSIVICNFKNPSWAAFCYVILMKTNVFFSDKSGDAFLFAESSEEGHLLLGHLSLLLDLLVTKASNGKSYILTCDRDEKIRVSEFPNCYNIHNFCLGHSDFVTGIAVVPDAQDLLISSSGDGTLKIWNFFTCTEIASRLCYPDAGVRELNTAGSENQEEKSGQEELKIKKRSTPAVKFFKIQKIDSQTLVAASIETYVMLLSW
jgi:WD40 repeat protein